MISLSHLTAQLTCLNTLVSWVYPWTYWHLKIQHVHWVIYLAWMFISSKRHRRHTWGMLDIWEMHNMKYLLCRSHCYLFYSLPEDIQCIFDLKIKSNTSFQCASQIILGSNRVSLRAARPLQCNLIWAVIYIICNLPC